MKIKSITFLLASLLLFTLTIPSIACDCEGDPPGECYLCWDGYWVQYGDCWYGCQDCKSCAACWCVCTSQCCKDSDCGPPGCWNCVDCHCESQCDPSKCEDCLDGTCQVCGGHPGIVCCGGECCDTLGLCKECVEGECVDKCDYDNCELCDGYGNCFSECDATQCCYNDTCVDNCTEDGQCNYGTLPSAYANCPSFQDPITNKCNEGEDALCDYVVDIALNDAQCASCEPNCDKDRVSYCVKITSCRCTTHCYGWVCACICDVKPEEYYTYGNQYQCAD